MLIRRWLLASSYAVTWPYKISRFNHKPPAEGSPDPRCECSAETAAGLARSTMPILYRRMWALFSRSTTRCCWKSIAAAWHTSRAALRCHDLQLAGAASPSQRRDGIYSCRYRRMKDADALGLCGVFFFFVNRVVWWFFLSMAMGHVVRCWDNGMK